MNPKDNFLWAGTVVNTADPLKKGRIKARVVPIFGEEVDGIADSDLPWAYPIFAFAGNNCGFLVIPPVKSTVFVTFFGGDAEFPIWLGSWITDKESIPTFETGYLPDPNNFVFQSPQGNKLVFLDKNLIQNIRLEDYLDQKILFSKTGIDIAGVKIGLAAGIITETAVTLLSQLAPLITANGVTIKQTAEVAIVQAASTSISQTSATITNTAITTLSLIAASSSIVLTGATILATCPNISLFGAAVILGVGTITQTLCNLLFLTLFNTHTHTTPGGVSSPPLILGIPGVHTTVHTTAS